MLRLTPALANPVRSIALLIALVFATALVAGCGADGQDPTGPQAETRSPAPTADDASVAVHNRTELHQFGDFTLYVPSRVGHVRGILLALGGPNTTGFAAGTPFGAPFPPVEASLQTLGEMFRDLAAERGLAILGTSRFAGTALPNGPASDQLLLGAIAQGAALSGRPELLDAPILLYGLSGGAPEASGFAARNPGRVSGLFLKVPAGIEPQTGGALGVPTYVVLAELDTFIDNGAMSAAFAAHRAAGAPWALAMEQDALHHSLTPVQRELTVNWMRTTLNLGPRPSAVGWLGDPATGDVAAAAAYRGDKSAASWFPTRALAEEWASFIGF